MSGAFQHMVTLLSFVLALGVSHQLFAVVGLVRAGSRVKWSWIHGLWMLNSFLSVITWWFGIWDFHDIQEWSVYSVLVNLMAVMCVFMAIAFVSPEVPEAGPIDLLAFHNLHIKKYAGFTFGHLTLGIGEALYFESVHNVPGQYLQAAIISVGWAASLAAILLPSAIAQRLAAVTAVGSSIAFLVIGDPVLR